MGLLEDLIRGAQQGGGGGLGDILGRMGQGGQPTNSGSVLEEINRRMGGESSQPAATNAPAGSDISVEDLERQLGIGRKGSSGSNYQPQQPQQPQQYPQQYPQQQYPQQPQYPQQYPQETQPMPQETAPSAGNQSSGGGLMSILKIIGIGAIAAMVLKKFRK